MVEQASELSYAVRLRVVLKYLGQLFLVVAVLTLVPLLVSLVSGEYHISWRYGVVVAGLVLPRSRSGLNRKRRKRALRKQRMLS